MSDLQLTHFIQSQCFEVVTSNGQSLDVGSPGFGKLESWQFLKLSFLRQTRFSSCPVPRQVPDDFARNRSFVIEESIW